MRFFGGIFEKLENLEIKGLMGMATFTDNQDQISREFKRLKMFYDELCNDYAQLTTLSTGMSGDYQIAVEEGSTMVRVGRALFGARNE